MEIIYRLKELHVYLDIYGYWMTRLLDIILISDIHTHAQINS